MSLERLLIKKIENKHLLVYYVSKVLNVYETGYPNREKLAYTLVVVAQKLSVFKSHSIIAYTNAPLGQIFHILDQSSRMLCWSIELCGYNISFTPRTTIKAQALSNIIAKTLFIENNMEDIPK